MTKITALAGALLALGVSALPAEAASVRSFVSGLGTDTGACGRTTPCRTFAYAIGQTTPGGEVDVLDAANYGSVTVTQAISIVQDGAGTAGISVPQIDGIAVTINAGATDAISLRGLTLDGGVAARYGIVFNSGGALTVTKCTIRGFLRVGIYITPTNAIKLLISSTVVYENSGPGIAVFPQPGGAVHGAFDSIASNHNSEGVLVNAQDGSASISISNSVFDGNATSGIGVSASTSVMVKNSIVSNSIVGIGVDPRASVYLAHSVSTLNKIGINVASGGGMPDGLVYTYGDNDINGNTTADVAGGTLIPVAQQ